MSELTKEDQKEGKELIRKVEEEPEVLKAIRDAVNFAQDFIDWDQIEKTDSNYRNRVVAFNFQDTGVLVGLRTVDRGLEVLDENTLEGMYLDRDDAPPVEGRIDIREELGRKIMAGKIAPQTIRYQFKDEMRLIAPAGAKHTFWTSCMTIFQYFHELRQALDKNLNLSEE